MAFPVLIERIAALYWEMKEKVYRSVSVIVEANAYQMAIVQQLKHLGIPCEPVKSTTDKRSRLTLVSPRIKSGDILFPKTGAEIMLSQIVNYGNERHDDLMDAFVICANFYCPYFKPFFGFV